MRRLLVAVVAALPLALCSQAGAITFTACAKQKDFKCATVPVPLDPSGVTPGTIDIHIAVQKTGPAPIMIALSGGPGQSSVGAASSFEASLKPIESRYRIAVLDQRGTGDSDALDCPSLQKTPTLDIVPAEAYAKCAGEIGAHRVFFTTADTVHDLDVVRQALGADKIGLMGVSYGTYVAQQYARTFPTHVARLILDSVVPAAGIDPFSLDTYSRLNRVLKSQCAHNACSDITRNLSTDVAALDQRLLKGSLSAMVPDVTGHMHKVTIPGAAALVNLIVEGDLNPVLQAAMPGAVAAALEADPAPLARLLRIANGAPTKLSDLSAGLNATTACADTTLPYSIQATPIEQRPALISQALAAIPATSWGPVDPQTALATSLTANCAQWPQDPFVPESTAPLPDVPALILDGQLDMRTPLENGAALHKLLPESKRVVVPGVGHDELDSDASGCADTALKRWIAGQPLQDPCANAAKANDIQPFVIPPESLSQLRLLPHTTGDRGRVVTATLLTISDAYVSLEETLFAGFSKFTGGGLRAGHFSGTLAGNLTLAKYAYVPGVELTGKLSLSKGLAYGTLRIDGVGTADGTIVFAKNGAITGELGGKAFKTAVPDTAAAKSAKAARAEPYAGPQLRTVLGALPRARRAWLALAG